MEQLNWVQQVTRHVAIDQKLLELAENLEDSRGNFLVRTISFPSRYLDRHLTTRFAKGSPRAEFKAIHGEEDGCPSGRRESIRLGHADEQI